jgi:hypothetical protein
MHPSELHLLDYVIVYTGLIITYASFALIRVWCVS